MRDGIPRPGRCQLKGPAPPGVLSSTMFLLRRPGDDTIRRGLARQASVPFGTAPPRDACTASHARVLLGVGAGTYDRARAALRGWEMFRLGWVAIQPPDAPLRVGA